MRNEKLEKKKTGIDMKKKTAAVRLALAAFALAALIQCTNPFYPFKKGGNWVAEYEIGETGPGGGKIFYISSGGFTMTNNGQTCHYLEAAPADITGTFAWASAGYTGTLFPGDFGTAIGTGRKNTTLILAENTAAPAAYACKNYGAPNDWFLPSKDELNELYQQKNTVGGFTTTWYWSSSQINNNYAWNQVFNNGNQTNDVKNNTVYVRAIRAF
jgi:hypothetical protein